MRMINKAVVAAVAVMVMGAVQSVHADPLDPKMVPATSKWVIHVDMDAARHTKLLEALQDRLANNDNFQAKVDEVETITGMRFPRDVHDFTLYGKSTDDEAGVVVIHGKINRERTLNAVASNPSYDAVDFGNYKVLSWEDKGKKLFGSFHDDSTVIIGHSEENIELALDTMDGKKDGIKDAPLASGAKPELMVYVGVVDLPGLKQQDKPQSPIVQQIDGGWIALEEKDNDALVTAKLNTKDQDTADKLCTTLTGVKAMISLAARNDDADPKLKMAASALKTMTPTQKESTVNIDWPISIDQAKDFLQNLPLDK